MKKFHSIIIHGNQLLNSLEQLIYIINTNKNSWMKEKGKKRQKEKEKKKVKKKESKQ